MPFHHSSATRDQLLTEIGRSASARHRPEIFKLAAWYAGGREGAQPETKALGVRALAALEDDLHWLFQPELPEGCHASAYGRRYVALRRPALRRSERSGFETLRGLLTL